MGFQMLCEVSEVQSEVGDLAESVEYLERLSDSRYAALAWVQQKGQIKLVNRRRSSMVPASSKKSQPVERSMVEVKTAEDNATEKQRSLVDSEAAMARTRRT
jgi:hypothetical protein